MTIKIEDIKKVDYQRAKTELELIEKLTEKINILTEYIRNLRVQIISADGSYIKILDLREKENKDGD